MVYQDEDGKTSSDYSTELEEQTDWQRWVNMLKAGGKGSLYEYIFTFSDTKPETGGYLQFTNMILYDFIHDITQATKAGLRFLNRAVGTPSGLGLFSGEGAILDSWEANNDGENKMIYITHFKYRLQGTSDSWTDHGAVQRAHKVKMPMTHKEGNDYLSGATVLGEYIDGEVVWNHTPNEWPKLHLSIRRALGKEIEDEFYDERGIENSVNWLYKAEDGTYKQGNDEYWTTRGYPDGRRYRLWHDGVMIDGAWSVGIGFVIFILKRFKLSGTILKMIAKQLSKKLGKIGLKTDVNEIIDILEADPTTDGSSNAINLLMDKLQYMESKFQGAYSPQKGVLRW